MHTCPKCGCILKEEGYILTEKGFEKVTKFYHCDICNEDFYDLDELENRRKR